MESITRGKKKLLGKGGERTAGVKEREMYFEPDALVIMKRQAGNAAAEPPRERRFAPRCLLYSITCIF